MLGKLLPRNIDNTYRGFGAALWLFGLVIGMRMLQSLMIIFNGYSTVRDADGISIDAYPAEATQTILGLFGLVSLWRLLFCLLGVLVLVRYRSAVPLMYVILLLNYLSAQLFSQFVPLVRTGTPPGPIVNLVLFTLMVIGLVLSLLSRRRSA